MEKWKKEYEEIKVPEELKGKMEAAILRAKKEKRKMKRTKLYKTFGSMAAVLVVALVVPNTSQTAAAAMQSIPVLGNFFELVTIRDYHVDTEHYVADVSVPELAMSQAEGEVANTGTGAAEAAQETVKDINIDIQAITDELLEEFQAKYEANEDGHHTLSVDSEVLTDDEKYFSLGLNIFEAEASGYERQRHYTIDKTTGKRVQLSDFYGEDYVEIITEEVKEQMREQMAADENVMYWVDDEMDEFSFKQIDEKQDFYVNKDGKVVICFDEYEVAPGSMGYIEFVLE